MLASLTFRIFSVSEYTKSPTLSNKIYSWTKENLEENKNDYKLICEKYKTSQYVFFVPFYHTTYDIRTNSNDKEGGADLLLSKGCNAVIGNWVTLTFPFNKILEVFNNDYYNSYLFRRMGISYVIFRKNFNSGNEKNYNTELVKKRIESDKNMLLLEENDSFVIYKNNYNEGLIKSDNLFFKKINPVKYRLYIKNIKNYQDIFFQEILNSNWNLF